VFLSTSHKFQPPKVFEHCDVATAENFNSFFGIRFVSVREVADGALVMSLHPQREKAGWMATWRERHGDSPDGSLKRKKDH